MTEQKLVIEDFVMVGNTVPQRDSLQRVTVCCAGYSKMLNQLVRIYPAATANLPKRWSVSRVPLVRNSKDTREESWKIDADRRPEVHDQINNAFQDRGKVDPTELDKRFRIRTSNSIAELNAAKRSLGLISVAGGTSTIDWGTGTAEAIDGQQELPFMPSGPKGKEYTGAVPYISFAAGGVEHRLQLRARDAGVYMQTAADRSGLYSSLHLDKDRTFLVGNLSGNRRNVWLVIAVFRGIPTQEATAPTNQLEMAFA
jgi:hypothetical protein